MLADRQLAIDTSYLKPSIYPLSTLYLPSISLYLSAGGFPLLPISTRTFTYRRKNFCL